MGQHRLEAAAEVAEGVSVLVDLNALAVVFYLRVHPVGTFLHGVLDRFTRLGLESDRQASMHFIGFYVTDQHKVVNICCVMRKTDDE